MGLYDKLKKQTEAEFRKFSVKQKENLPELIRQCPKCSKLSLRFNKNKWEMYCTECNFKAIIPKKR